MTKTPETFPLFHWSPARNRKQINHSGTVPGSRSVDGEWKPPYTCWSNSPSLAWALSGKLRDPAPWDLWTTWSNVPSGYEELYEDRTGAVKEFRVYERIWKRDLWLVATRDWK